MRLHCDAVSWRIPSMKVFVSWSGPKSRFIASAFKDWLPDLVQSIEVFMSQHDIEAGSRWGNELSSQLHECNFGIICITPNNISAPWLLFEAGCLGKSIDQSRVIPYRIGIDATDVAFPLAQFQSVSADKDGTYKLLESINSINPSKLDPDRLRRLFDRLWPDLESTIKEANDVEEDQKAKRADRDLLEEILQITRGIDRDLKRTPESSKSSESVPADSNGESFRDTEKAISLAAIPEHDDQDAARQVDDPKLNK